MDSLFYKSFSRCLWLHFMLSMTSLNNRAKLREHEGSIDQTLPRPGHPSTHCHAIRLEFHCTQAVFHWSASILVCSDCIKPIRVHKEDSGSVLVDLGRWPKRQKSSVTFTWLCLTHGCNRDFDASTCDLRTGSRAMRLVTTPSSWWTNIWHDSMAEGRKQRFVINAVLRASLKSLFISLFCH